MTGLLNITALTFAWNLPLKKRAHNCLTVSNYKLNDVFTDIFGKLSRSIIEQILQEPGETFTPFADGMYNSY